MDCTNYMRDEDVAMFEREFDSFVPDKVYDAHCHLLCLGIPNRWGTTVSEMSAMPNACGCSIV